MATAPQLENAWLVSVAYAEHEWHFGEESIWFNVDEAFVVTRFQPEDDGAVAATGELELRVRWYADEEITMPAERAPFDLTMRLAGDFRFDVGTEERFARAWLEYNGAYLLWPYARANAATVTGLGRLPKLTLYTRRLPELPEIESEEDVRPAATSVENS